MNTKISICVFIKDNNDGAFCLWESMATLMPFADEFFVMDLGSTDGTYETLKDLASKNKKIRVEQSSFPVNPETGMIDAGSFAEIPNEMIPRCKNDIVMYYQADEIWHENLLKLMVDRIDNNFNGLAFWRYQLRDNFQKMKWFPHPVHRVDYKDRFNFTGDGMNTDRTNDVDICSNYDGGWFTRWGAEFSEHEPKGLHESTADLTQEFGNKSYDLPTHEMILDISSTGGFLENIVSKRKKHAPLWRESELDINIGGTFHNLENWYRKQLENPDWTKDVSPYNIPEIMKPLVGLTKYPVRQDLLNKIANL